MAILENETKNYFKVDLKQCFIQNNMVFASITVYASETDRQNEKQRLDEFTAFDEKCKRILRELRADERYTELSESFAKAFGEIRDKRNANVESALSHATFPQEVTQLLTQCGYQPEWLNQSIRIISKCLVNCGIDNKESLTSEYIYGKLKSKMSSNILDI